MFNKAFTGSQSVNVRRDLQMSYGPTPCSSRSTQRRFLSTVSRLLLKILKDRDYKSNFSNVFLCFLASISGFFAFFFLTSDEGARTLFLQKHFVTMNTVRSLLFLCYAFYPFQAVLCFVHLRFSRPPSRTALSDLHFLQSADFLYPCVLFLWDH